MAHHETNLSNLRQAINYCLMRPTVQSSHVELYLSALLSESFDLPQELLWGNYSDCSYEVKKDVVSEIVSCIEKRLTYP